MQLILCYPLLLLPSVFPSIRVFSSESAFPIREPKNWNFSFSISPSSECSGLISFWIDWFDLLTVQGTLKSLTQHHNSKASILWCSVFIMVQFSHPFMLSSVQFSCSVVSDSLRPHESQHTRPPCPSPTPGVHSNSCPWSRWCIQPSHPLSFPTPSAPNPSQHQSLFQWVNSSHEVAKVLEFHL